MLEGPNVEAAVEVVLRALQHAAGGEERGADDRAGPVEARGDVGLDEAGDRVHVEEERAEDVAEVADDRLPREVAPELAPRLPRSQEERRAEARRLVLRGADVDDLQHPRVGAEGEGDAADEVGPVDERERHGPARALDRPDHAKGRADREKHAPLDVHDAHPVGADPPELPRVPARVPELERPAGLSVKVQVGILRVARRRLRVVQGVARRAPRHGHARLGDAHRVRRRLPDPHLHRRRERNSRSAAAAQPRLARGGRRMPPS